MVNPVKQAEINFWNRDWGVIGAGHHVEQLCDVESEWQLYEVVKFRFLEKLFSMWEAGDTMLECGCGSAGVSLYFARRGRHCTMIDFAPSALQVAEENFTSYGTFGTFVRGDVEALPFRSNTYDIVASFGLLEHFVNPTGAIREMVRVLKPGGLFFADIVPRRFCVQSIANYSFNLWAVLLFTLISRNWRRGWAKIKFVLGMPEYYENSYTIEQYTEMMCNAGLANIEIRGNNPFPRLYLPRHLGRFYLRLLIRLLPIWERFNNAHSHFADTLWARAWWACAHKPH
jgi:ubiquinone/menaquinone biosynthesis C-methylase UbiE